MEYDKEKNLSIFSKYIKKLFATGFVSVFNAGVINKIVNFAYGIVLIRVISKSAYGSYSYANNIYSYFALLLGLGIASSLLQVCSEVRDDNKKKIKYLDFCFSFSIYINVILSIAVIFFSFVIKTEIRDADILLRTMGLLPIFTQFTPLYSNWLRANFKNEEYAKLNNLNTILIALFSIGGAFTFQAYGLIIGRYLAAIGTTIYAVFSLKCPWPRLKTISFLHNYSGKRRILKIAVTLCISEAFVQIISLIGVSILAIYIPNEELIASYKTATVVPTALSFVANAVLVYAYPYFASNKENIMWTRKAYLVLLAGISFGVGLITLFGIILARPIVTVLFGSQYVDSIIPFKILMVNLFISSVLRIPANNLLITQMKLRFCFVVSILGAISTVILNVGLIPNYGSNGAAIAQLLSTVLLGLSYSVFYIYLIFFKNRRITE